MEGGQVKAESFIGLVQENHLLLQQLIQVLVLQHRIPQNARFQKYGDQKLVETPWKFAIFFHVKHSDFRFTTWFMLILEFGLPGLSFEIFWTKTKTELFWAILVSSKKSTDFELMLSRQICQINHMLNYVSGNVLCVKLVLLKVSIISKFSIILNLVYHLEVSIKFKN